MLYGLNKVAIGPPFRISLHLSLSDKCIFCLFKPVEEAAKVSTSGVCAVRERLTVYVVVINRRYFWYKDSRLIDYKSEAATSPYFVN